MRVLFSVNSFKQNECFHESIWQGSLTFKHIVKHYFSSWLYMYNPSNPGSNTVMHVYNKINTFAIFCQTMGHLHDDVIQRLLVEPLGCLQTDATLLTNNSQHCWMLHVGSVCTPWCMLLNVVACCCTKFETDQTFSPVQTDATLLAYNSHCNSHWWELLHLFAHNLRVLLSFF